LAGRSALAAAAIWGHGNMAAHAKEIPALLDCLLNPRGVALIGASDDAGKVSGRPLRFLRENGFAAPVYPINPRRSTVQGERAYGSLGEIEGPIDHAYILLDSDAAIDAVAMCAEAGVPTATVLADGFAEAGQIGLDRQARLLDIVGRSGIRVLGPNSMGAIDVHNGFVCTVNAALARIKPKPGRFAVLSQSGTILGALLSRGEARKMHFSAFVSLGNEADLDVGEIGEALVDHAESEGFILFLESIRHPERIARFAAAAHARGKPIIAYKLGRSGLGQELAISHTGAVVGSDAAADAFFDHHGIYRVDQFESLLELPLLNLAVERARKTRGSVPAVATVVTATGGGGALVADRLAAQGVEVRGLDPTSRASLQARGIKVGSGPLIDVSLAGANYDMMKTVFREVISDTASGIAVVVLGSSANASPALTVAPIIDAVREAGESAAPVIVFLVPDAGEAMERLGAAGIVASRSPETCAETVALALNAHPPRCAPAIVTSSETAAAVARAKGPVLSEAEAGEVLKTLGIARPKTTVVPNGAPLPQFGPADFPVAAKLISPDLPHKTEAGAVTLSITDREALEVAIERMRASAAAFDPSASIEGVLVQSMVAGGTEVMIGLTRDPSVGATISLSPGGVLAELYRDHDTRLAPVIYDEALAMIEGVRGLASIRGYRGMPRGDLEALASAIVNLSTLAAYENVVEAEINPLIVKGDGDGVVAVDCLLRKSEP